MGNAYPQERAASTSRYTILGRLASGGMADIYLVLASAEAGVNRHLVLKRVLAERARDPAFVEMFLDEARLAAQLHHPNIAQVYDVGKLDGTYFFTMEYVHGEDIRGLLHRLGKQRQYLPVNLALYVANGALAALHHAHERTTPDGTPLGVVHRDVSPSNIMVSYEGAIKLLDFGVAKATQRTTQSQSGSIKGKVAYLSPEQIQSKGIDRRSDIFSLGIVLYEMLVGRRLFKREADFQAMMAIVTEDIPPPSQRRSELSPEIDRIVMTALEKDRDRRYPTAAAMLEDLEAVATAERHLLSATAMGRFMGELFGSKPAPWIELRAREGGGDRQVTVTNQSLSGFVPPSVQRAQSGEHEPPSLGDASLDELGPQLEHAPDLRSFTPSRLSSSFEELRRTPTSMPAVAPPPESVVPPPESVVARSSRGIAIIIATLVTLGLGAGGFWLWQQQTQQSEQSASPREMAVSATAPPEVESVNAAAAPASAPVVPQTPAPEAAVAPPAEAPPAANDPPAPPERSSEVSCTGNVPPADRRQCGVAACEQKDRAAALVHYREAARVDQQAIDQACRAQSITLVRALAKPKPKPKAKVRPDACADPAYLKANPLKCP